MPDSEMPEDDLTKSKMLSLPVPSPANRVK